jgi:hypothetical protein
VIRGRAATLAERGSWPHRPLRSLFSDDAVVWAAAVPVRGESATRQGSPRRAVVGVSERAGPVEQQRVNDLPRPLLGDGNADRGADRGGDRGHARGHARGCGCRDGRPVVLRGVLARPEPEETLVEALVDMVSTDVPVDVVRRPVTIGVSGPDWAGRTRFLARLEGELHRRGITVVRVGGVGAEAERRGLRRWWDQDWVSTLWMVTRGISQEVEAWSHADVVLVDQVVLDALGCYQAALAHRGARAQPHELACLNHLVRFHSRRYDLIIRVTVRVTVCGTLDRPMTAGDTELGQRVVFRQLAEDHIGQVLEDLRLPCTTVHADDYDHAAHQAITLVHNTPGLSPRPLWDRKPALRLLAPEGMSVAEREGVPRAPLALPGCRAGVAAGRAEADQ